MNIFMQEAIALALFAVEHSLGGPFGAVVVKAGKVVGRGFNSVTSSNDPTAHAEMTAIREACKHLDTFWLTECEIYTSCEPCPMCLGAIYWSRLPVLYYGANRFDAAAIAFDDSFFYEELTKKSQERAVKMVELMREEALGPFKKWQHKADKVYY